MEKVSKLIDDIKAFVSISKNFSLEWDESCCGIDLYHGILKWGAVFGNSQLKNPMNQAHKIFLTNSLSHDIDNLTEKSNKNMIYFWTKAASSIPIEKVKLNVFKFFRDIELKWFLHSEGSLDREYIYIYNEKFKW